MGEKMLMSMWGCTTMPIDGKRSAPRLFQNLGLVRVWILAVWGVRVWVEVWLLEMVKYRVLLLLVPALGRPNTLDRCRRVGG